MDSFGLETQAAEDRLTNVPRIAELGKGIPAGETLMNRDGPLWALEEIELLRGRALGASPARLSQLLMIARGEQSHLRRERLPLTRRALDRLFKVARRLDNKRPGGIERSYTEAVQALPGRCPFCRQYFELLDDYEEEFCDECIAAGVDETLYAELIFSLQKLRLRRQEDS